MKRTTIAILLAAVLPAVAHGDGGGFSVYDADQDGYLDRAEYGRFLGAQPKRNQDDSELACDAVDTDGDGRVSGSEMVAVLPKRLERRLKARDKR